MASTPAGFGGFAAGVAALDEPTPKALAAVAAVVRPPPMAPV